MLGEGQATAQGGFLIVAPDGPDFDNFQLGFEIRNVHCQLLLCTGGISALTHVIQRFITHHVARRTIGENNLLRDG
ncbi:hypothetical protein D3C71_2069710 [compost metagenome]